MNIDFNYLQEKTYWRSRYFKTKINLENNENGLFSLRQRETCYQLSEFYNLSYEYINDCLKAGLVYRRVLR